MINDNLLEELIEKHNFIVRVSLDPDDDLTVMVDFAGRKQAYYRVIMDEEGEVYGIGYWSSVMIPVEDEETGEKYATEEMVFVPKTAVRLYILGDIYRQCRELDLSTEIVRFYNKEDEPVNFSELLTLPLNEQDIEVEQVLESCLDAILNKSIPTSTLTEALEKDGLLHQFNFLKATLI